MLDRVLAHYGPETNRTRDRLRSALNQLLDQTWSHDGNASSLDPATAGQEVLYETIQQLSRQNDAQSSLRASAISIVNDLGQTRWLIYEQAVTGLSRPLLIVMVFWHQLHQ
jgi:hypothetical protein